MTYENNDKRQNEYALEDAKCILCELEKMRIPLPSNETLTKNKKLYDKLCKRHIEYVKKILKVFSKMPDLEAER